MSAPMDGLGWLNRLSRRIERLGVDVERPSDLARRQDVEAITIDCIDHPRILICFRDEAPTVSAVLEEIAHAAQARKRHFTECHAEELQIRREIEVNACLDRLGERLGLSAAERNRTRRRLELERERLRRLEDWKR